MLYLKLTIRNARRSFVDYLLYIAAVTVLTAVTEVSVCIAVNGEAAGFQTGSLPLMITLIQIVLAGYMDTFMLKQRAKEFANYLLLGMEKEKLTHLFLGEVFLIGICCYVAGTTIGFAVYGFWSLCQPMQDIVSGVSLYGKSILAAFFCFCLMEMICCLRLKKRLHGLLIKELLYEGCRSQRMQQAENHKIWGRVFLFCFVCFLCLICGIVFLPTGRAVYLVPVVVIPLLLSIFTFYQWVFGSLYALRKRKSVSIYQRDRLYIIAGRTTNFKSAAVVNTVFCVCLLFSACSFIMGRLMLHPAFPGWDQAARQWMGIAQISICIVFLVIYFFILSLQQIIEIREGAKNDRIMRYLGKSNRQMARLVRRQSTLRLTSPMIMAVIIVICCMPLLNRKLNLFLPNTMRHMLLRSGGEFGACILTFYLCYFGMISVMSRRFTGGKG